MDPHPFSVRDGLFIEDREVVDDQNYVEAAFRAALNRYLHGFNNFFGLAASAHAEIGHFLGRRGVPISYSWGAAPEQLVRLIHLVPLRGCESQRSGAVTVVPMAGEVTACADVWEFSRPARPDDRRHYLEVTVDG